MSLTLLKRRVPNNGGSLAQLRDEMDRTFDRFFTDPLGAFESKLLRTEGWVPPLDLSETESEVTIRAELPGIAVKDLTITVSGNLLTLAGKKEEQQERKGEGFYLCERRFGSFNRVIDLPDYVDPEKVTAESDNGVVTIHVAKKPNARPKQVEVKPINKKIDVVS